jgi:hypothetical protein
MFSDSLATGGWFSSHWTVVLVVALLFFSLQVALFIRISWSLRRQERWLGRLCGDLAQGGDGRPAAHALSDSFAWLDWVLTIFPANSATPPGSYTRDSVLQELDTRLASNSSYLLLQRMGVMAPLLGVILTVAGFWYLRVEDSGEMRLQDILFAVTPLVSGVGAGAVLALVNQGLLHGASQRIESLRMAARTWFDRAIWSSVGLDSQAATVGAISAVERMTTAISGVAEQHADCAVRLKASTSDINDSAREFRDAVQTFGGQIQGVPQTLAELNGALQASSAALENLIQIGSRAVANLDVSVAAFRTTMDQEFANAAKLQHLSTQRLADATGQVRTTSELMKVSAQDLNATVDANKRSYSSLNEAIEGRLLEVQNQFQTVTERVSTRLDALIGHLESVASKVSSTANEFHSVFGQFAPAVTSFRTAVEHHFRPATAQHQQQVVAASESMQQLKAATSSLSHRTTAAQTMLDRQREFAEAADRTQHLLSGAIENLALVVARLHKVVENRVAPSNDTLHDAANALAVSTEQLASFVDGGLGQATKRLGKFDETLSRLEGSLTELQQFSRSRDDIDRLAESLSRVSEAGDAMADVPERVHEILEQFAIEQGSHLTTRGKIMNWFRHSESEIVGKKQRD